MVFGYIYGKPGAIPARIGLDLVQCVRARREYRENPVLRGDLAGKWSWGVERAAVRKNMPGMIWKLENDQYEYLAGFCVKEILDS